MLGSTIIAEKDRSRLAALASMDDLDDFVHVGLDSMTSIDFETFCDGWAEGEAVQFDEEGGLSIVKVSEAGLTYLLSHAAEVPEEHKDDVRKLADFVSENGKSHIYELATF
jgi:hypothetical protein